MAEMRKNLLLLSGTFMGFVFFPNIILARNLPANYQPYYAENFLSGFGSCVMKQGSVSLVNAPGGISGKVLKAQLRKSDNFPGSGIDLGRCGKIQAGHDYMIMWNAYIPPDALVDPRQSDGMVVIRSDSGATPFRLSLSGERYTVDIGNGKTDKRYDAGPAGGMGKQSGDKGYWIRWALHYFPDSRGGKSVTELYKNNTLVLAANGQPNASANGGDAHLEIGVFRPDWKRQPSNVSRRTMYYSEVTVGVKP
jgi:hypothetical protein